MIEIRNLSKSFNGVSVLKDVNAHVAEGEVISIIGPSGTGKSTMLRCLNQLETPDGGEILYKGCNIVNSGASKIRAMREKVCMVFQSFNLFSHLMAVENLMLGPITLLGKSRRESYDKALELLHMVGLSEKALSYPAELSGGQKQRVAIARALAMEPEVILFDEPTSALDPTMVDEVLSIMRRLAKQGLTMLIVTHEMRFAREVSNRVFYMDEGVIYEEGSAKQIFDEPRRDKTRAFVHKLKSVTAEIKGSGFDLYGLNSKIMEFGIRWMIEPKQLLRVQLAVEELLTGVLPPALNNNIAVSLTIYYGEETGMAEIVAAMRSEAGNLLETGNELSLEILRGISGLTRQQHSNGAYSIIVQIPKN